MATCQARYRKNQLRVSWRILAFLAIGFFTLAGCQRKSPPTTVMQPAAPADAENTGDADTGDADTGDADTGDADTGDADTGATAKEVDAPADATPAKAAATPANADATPAKADAPAKPNATPAKADVVQPDAVATGPQLYARHCAGCHGKTGDGKGLAARFLFPKPRDFRSGRFRLVSTTNGAPTAADLDAVLVRGMPGSAMPPWPQLSEPERKLLVEEVAKLRREGAAAQFIQMLKEEEELEDDEIEQDEVQEFVARRTTPGPVSEVPTIAPANAASIARGKELYVKQSCHSCHGVDGKGDGQQKMVDDEGLPTRPRDFTQGVFKGGHDVASIYRRIASGMPGTPMPSSQKLTPEQVVDLVQFTLSLSDEAARQATILRREKITVKRVDTLAGKSGSEVWSSINPIALRMTPLWWRDGADPGLQIQAAHDGKHISVRLSWSDETADRNAAKTDAFEDAVALELYRGPSEPFIGMGDPNSPVDVWFWDADRQGPMVTVEDIYPNMVVDRYPFSEAVASTADYNRPATKLKEQPNISLPAKASGNQIVPDGSGSSNLTVAGPGSVTFRLPTNPQVAAHGEWSNGRWTVVMTRPLSLGDAGRGISLEPGCTASIALAIWDGTQNERDGKKLITIWQDLILEN